MEPVLEVRFSPFLLFLSARSYNECAEISYFDFDLKNNTKVLWIDNLIIAIRSVRKKEISWY